MQAAAASTITRSTPRPRRAPETHLRPVPDLGPPTGHDVVHVSVADTLHTVRVSGEIDLLTGDSIVEAVGRLRARHPRRAIVVNTSAVEFIDPAGYRLRRALSRPDGTRDPLVSHVTGPAVLRLELVLEMISRPRSA